MGAPYTTKLKLLRRETQLSKKIVSNDNQTEILKVIEEHEYAMQDLEEEQYKIKKKVGDNGKVQMQNDPTYFYKFQRRFSSGPSGIVNLKIVKYDNKIIIHDEEEKSNVLASEYSSVCLSTPLLLLAFPNLEYLDLSRQKYQNTKDKTFTE